MFDLITNDGWIMERNLPTLGVAIARQTYMQKTLKEVIIIRRQNEGFLIYSK